MRGCDDCYENGGLAQGRRSCRFFASRRRHTRFDCDWSSDVCSSDLVEFARSLQASSLKSRRLPLASCGVVHVSQVVEDPVGGPIVLDPRVELEGAIAMFEGQVEIADCPSRQDRKSTRLNSSHSQISYAVFCLKKKNRS